MKLINIGYGNLVNADRIVAVVSPESAPVKRMIVTAKENGSLIDASCGKKTKAVIMTHSNHIILTALSAERIGGRAETKGDDEND